MKKLIIILGINGNLGAALTNELLKKNLAIVGVDIQPSTYHSGITYFQCDIGSKDQITKTVAQINYQSYKKIIFISTIGLFGAPTFNDNSFKYDEFCKSIEVNLIGVCCFISAALARCFSADINNIRIIVVGSTAANVGSLNLGYGVSKAGLNGFVRSISKSLAQKGVVCIGVNPGIFESTMSKSVSQERQNSAINSTHIKRIGQIDEVSKFVVSLALEAPDYLTGSIVSINGGQCS